MSTSRWRSRSCPARRWDVSADAVQEFDHGTTSRASSRVPTTGSESSASLQRPRSFPYNYPAANRYRTARRRHRRFESVYAADIGADVIDLSLAYTRVRHGGINDLGTEDPSDDVVYTAAEAAALATAFARATEYAHARGCTIITGTSQQYGRRRSRRRWIPPSARFSTRYYGGRHWTVGLGTQSGDQFGCAWVLQQLRPVHRRSVGSWREH